MTEQSKAGLTRADLVDRRLPYSDRVLSSNNKVCRNLAPNQIC
jgi:hypothetical protein